VLQVVEIEHYAEKGGQAESDQHRDASGCPWGYQSIHISPAAIFSVQSGCISLNFFYFFLEN
jgi:hypothetical protein